MFKRMQEEKAAAEAEAKAAKAAEVKEAKRKAAQERAAEESKRRKATPPEGEVRAHPIIAQLITRLAPHFAQTQCTCAQRAKLRCARS
jgi:membrane protein involved in colicin uptake